MSMPRYSSPDGVYYSLPLKPPFYFENMTARVFPLRASLAALQNFVNRFLNIIPEELGRFHVVVPYAYLMMIDYGRLALQQSNLGWIAQTEIMFTVPVAWYRVIEGRWVFQEWAWVTPFIFVNSPISLTLGRQVYGWPKLFAELTPTVPDWMKDPRAPVRNATLSANVFAEVYSGKEQAPRVLLEVDERAAATPLALPLDTQGPFTPWTAMSNTVASMMGFAADYRGLLAGLGVPPGTRLGDPANLVRMATLGAQMVNPFQNDLYFNTLNLKQFPDSADPKNYCYQALTSADMRVSGVNGAGLLGDLSTLAGDASGGYAIRLNSWPTLPIVQTLGLEVSRRWQGEGCEVCEVRPVVPFWYDIDMTYERGVNVAWRSFDTVWHGEERSYPPPASQDDGCARLFNTTLGNASGMVTGPFKFTNTVVRVLPLLARKARLQAFLENYLNLPLRSAGERFVLWCSPGDADQLAYVYMLATSYDDITSGSNNVGRWSSEDLTIMIPVRWQKKVGGEWVTQGVGTVPAFTFVADLTAAISGSEVLGIPTTQALFTAPPTTWMRDPSPEAHQALLSIGTQVLPALDLGQKAVMRTVLEIHEGEIFEDCDPGTVDGAAEQWGLALASEIAREQRLKREHPGELRDARALSLELLREAPWNVFTMKQFRDVHEPDYACYQSIVRIPRRLDHLHEVREIKRPIHVRIHEYPSLPMVELLGLEATLAHDQSGGAVCLLRPVSPFWVRMAWTEQLGQRMWYRAGTEVWRGQPAGLEERAPTVGRTLGDLIDDGAPRALKVVTDEWIALGGVAMSPAAAAAAVREIDPQMVIETILAREWENASPDALWLRARVDLARRLHAHVEGEPVARKLTKEVEFFDQELKRIELDSNHPPVVKAVRYKLRLLVDLGTARASFEQASAELATSGKVSDGLKLLFKTGLDALRQALESRRLAAESSTTPMVERPDTARVRDLLAKLTALGAGTAPFWAMCNADPGPLVEIVALVRKAYKAQREAVLDKLSKASQEPDFSVPRSSAGPAKDRLFPEMSSRNGSYVGPAPTGTGKKG